MLGKKYKQPLEIKYKEFYGWSGQQMEKLCVFGFFQTFWILLTFPSVDANETISNILHSFHHWVYRFYFQGFFLLGREGERGSPHNQSHQLIFNLFSKCFAWKQSFAKFSQKWAASDCWTHERSRKWPAKINSPTKKLFFCYNPPKTSFLLQSLM